MDAQRLNFPSFQDCQLYVFSGRNQIPSHQLIYEKSYICWKEAWSHVFQREMEEKHHLYSDDFTRQDEIVTLFWNDQCVGVAFKRFVNLNLISNRDDSCFRYWPSEQLNKICSMSSTITLASYFTVHSNFRGKDQSICWKTLFLSLFIENFIQGSSKLMVTAARRMKSNEKLCYQLGARPLAIDLPYLLDGNQQVKKESVDLILWEKDIRPLENSDLEDLKNKIWKNRITDYLNPKREVQHAS